jgi:hypothetical protein
MTEREELLELAMAEPVPEELVGQAKMRARWSQGYFTGKLIERKKIVNLLKSDFENYGYGDPATERIYLAVISLIESRNKK